MSIVTRTNTVCSVMQWISSLDCVFNVMCFVFKGWRVGKRKAVCAVVWCVEGSFRVCVETMNCNEKRSRALETVCCGVRAWCHPCMGWLCALTSYKQTRFSLKMFVAVLSNIFVYSKKIASLSQTSERRVKKQWFWSVVFRINMCTVRPYRAVIACMCASVMIDRLMQLMHASRAVHASHAE